MPQVRSYGELQMYKLFNLLAFLFLISLAPVFGQQPANSESADPELKELIRRASLGVTEYKAKFKDIYAEEQQKIDEYDSQGKLTKQRRLVADLVIYQSQLDATQMVEYRDVKSVDGVAIKKREARLQKLFTQLAKADSVKQELERVSRESSRYDRGFSFTGLTLYQGLPLDENLRETFRFRLAGREQVEGHETIVVEYQQVSESPKLAFNLSLPTPLKGSEARYRGRLWLDAGTAQLRREVRELTLRPPLLSQPLTLMRYALDYADSRFGILTPQRITISNYSRGRTGADKVPVLLLGEKVTYEYSAFTRFEVETPDASLTPPVKP